jgi:hypothetical protein
MKRWAIATVALYVIALVLLTTPAFLVGFAGWAPPPDPAGGFDIGDLLDAYAWYGTWIWLAVLAGGQALFLLVPIHIRRAPAAGPQAGETSCNCYGILSGESPVWRSAIHRVCVSGS